jgi:hypothetical protein
MQRIVRRLTHLVRGDEGQAMVEAALVLPLMTFLVVGVIQLVMIQHARVLTEYAAFQATRAGVVHNADPKYMLNAALISVLPTMGATDTMIGERDPFTGRRRPGILEVWAKAKLLLFFSGEVQCGIASLQHYLQGLAADIPFLNIPAFTPRVGLVNIERINPKQTDLPEAELDFDCIEGTCQGIAAARARELNRLSIRLRYNFRMRVPFASQFIHDMWLAGVMGRRIDNRLNPVQDQFEVFGQRRVLSLRERIEFAVLRLLADGGMYFIPIDTTYAMHMQSNLYRANLKECL